MKKSKPPFLGQILKKIAPKIGAKVVLEPQWQYVGQIIYPNGRKRYFRYSSLDINPLGATEIAKDKDYTNFFMKQMGYPIVPGKTFFSNSWCKAIGSARNITAAYRYATKSGFPVIVKPNSGSQGFGVAKVYTQREFFRAIRSVFARDRVALVQRPVKGNDYRVVVLDDQVISVYQRLPLHVVGDGRSTIHQLLQRKQKEFIAIGRDTQISIKDPRIALKLKRQKLSLKSIPNHGEVIYLLDNANLSTGGDAIDLTHAIHPEFRAIAVRLTKDMGLRLCGVDFIVDGDIGDKPGRYWILEINAAPGLDHYVKSGREQEQLVENLYLAVLKAME